MTDISSIDSKLVSLANDILKEDKDGIVSESEISSYVKTHETELQELGIDTSKTSIISELKDILGTEDSDEEIGHAESAEEGEIDELKARIARYDELLGTYDKSISDLKANGETLEKELKERLEAYNTLEKKLLEENDELKDKSEEIEKEKSTLELQVSVEYSRAAYKAMSQYDPSSGKSWEDYLEDNVKADDIYRSMPMFYEMMNTISKSDRLSETIGYLQTNLKAQADSIDVKADEIKINNQNIEKFSAMRDRVSTLKTAASDRLDSLEAAAASSIPKGVTYPSSGTFKARDVDDKTKDDIMGKIPECERKLAEELKINWSEKLEGTEPPQPRYIIAKGASVEEGDVYHIYDMANWNCNGDNSLVRLQYGYDGPSFEMIPCGNGGITPNTFTYGDELGRTVYFMDDCNTMKSAGACYQTWSPLSLDLDDNGFSTKDTTVHFDLNGDGLDENDYYNDANDAVIVFDADGDGISGENGKELFGDNTDLSRFGITGIFNNGFEALSALSSVAQDVAKENIDKIQNSEDLDDATKARLIERIQNGDSFDADSNLDTDELIIMEKVLGLGVKLDGYTSEVKSLVNDADVTSIQLSKNAVGSKESLDDKGNEIQYQEGATFTTKGKDGLEKTHDYADVWHRAYSEEEAKSIDAEAVEALDSDLLAQADSISLRLQDTTSSVEEVSFMARATSQNARTEAKKDHSHDADSAIRAQSARGEMKEDAYEKELEAQEAKDKAAEDEEEAEAQRAEEEASQEPTNSPNNIEYMRYRYHSDR